MAEDKFACLILAAGKARRMGSCKALLPLGEGECAFHALGLLAQNYRKLGIGRILVVTGFHAEAVEAQARTLNFALLRNPQPERGMFSSLTLGLQFWQHQDPVPRACFIQPVDVPLIRPLTIQALLAHFHADPDKVAIPAFLGRPGHPPLIGSKYFPDILAWQGDGGLSKALQSLPQSLVDVADSTILKDMDTPSDYQRLCRLAPYTNSLHPLEARELLRIHKVSPKGFRHAEAVGSVAARFARELLLARQKNGQSSNLRPALARAGGLLHDLAKGVPHHEKAGALILEKMHLPAMAALVRDHRDLTILPEQAISERELVYLADKYCFGPNFVTIEERFGEKLAHACDLQSAQAIVTRREHAKALEARLALEIGCAPASIAQKALSPRN